MGKGKKKGNAAAKASLGSAKASKAANNYIQCYGPAEQTSKKRTKATKKTNKLEQKQAKIERKLIICDGLNARFDNIKSGLTIDTNSLRQKSTRLDKRLYKAQEIGDTNKAQAIQSKKSNLDQKIEKKNLSIQGIDTKKQQVSLQAQALENSITQISVLKVQSGTKAASLFEKENNLIKKALRHEDQFDRQSTNSELASLEVDRIDCKCPAIYDPIVIDGVTYGNPCIAACKGKTLPTNPTPPVSKPPIGSAPRVCLDVIVCGSDGVTYPNSCLPVGVHAIKYGSSCGDIDFTPSDPSVSRGRPPAQIADGRILNLVRPGDGRPQTVCGSNNVTYNSHYDIPQGITIKYFGACAPHLSNIS